LYVFINLKVPQFTTPRDGIYQNTVDNWIGNDFGDASFNGDHTTSTDLVWRHRGRSAQIDPYQNNSSFTVDGPHLPHVDTRRVSSAATCWKGGESSWACHDFRTPQYVEQNNCSQSRIWSVAEKKTEFYSNGKGAESTGRLHWPLKHYSDNNNTNNWDAGGHSSSGVNAICTTIRHRPAASATCSKTVDMGCRSTSVDCAERNMSSLDSLSYPFPCMSTSFCDMSSYDIDPDDKTIFEELRI
jgi:hypothetical protein